MRSIGNSARNTALKSTDHLFASACRPMGNREMPRILDRMHIVKNHDQNVTTNYCRNRR